MKLTDELRNSLCKQAADAAVDAYAPYSKFKVGSAVLTSSGKVYAGCNVENASYGLTLCAERVATAVAVSAGQKNLTAIAVASKDAVSPCGACRQVLAEFATEETEVLIASLKGVLVERISLSELLPRQFRFQAS
ncbi:cytidine deaminase [bacterium]|nr:cytidine deaminase [bacterium]